MGSADPPRRSGPRWSDNAVCRRDDTRWEMRERLGLRWEAGPEGRTAGAASVGGTSPPGPVGSTVTRSLAAEGGQIHWTVTR